MFRHSVVALAYFDEDGDRLQRRKDLNWSCLWRIDVVVLAWDNRECESDDNLQTDMFLRQSYCFILVLSNNYARIYIYIPVYIYYEYIIYNVLYVYINIYVDTSWLELFWGFLFDTSLLPPVFHGGEWKTVDDDESVYFVLPSARSLFVVWKRHVDSLCRGGLCVPWETRLASVSSVSSLGAKFRCAGIGGFVPVLKSALSDLFCSSTVLLRCVIFGSPMLISFSNLVSWPADNLLAQWPVSRHDRDECVRVYIYIYIHIYIFTLIFMYILTHGWKQPCTSAS